MKKSEELIKNISEGKNLNFEESKSIFVDIIAPTIAIPDIALEPLISGV